MRTTTPFMDLPEVGTLELIDTENVYAHTHIMGTGNCNNCPCKEFTCDYPGQASEYTKCTNTYTDGNGNHRCDHYYKDHNY